MSLTFKGVVVHGRGEGKKIGFPTANIKVLEPEGFFPEFGVYIVKVFLKDKEYKGLLAAGSAKTFKIKKPSLEAYIVGLKEDIYDENLKIDLIEKIRDIKKFKTVKELKEQIKKDLERLN